MPPTPFATDDATPPNGQRVLTAALQCYLCAQTCGALERPAGAVLPRIAGLAPVDHLPGLLEVQFAGPTRGRLWRRVAGTPGRDCSASRNMLWQRLRCPGCGSASLMLEQLDVLARRTKGPLGLLLEQPRRGRQRSLVELRAREEAA
jgi:hypothetical protein